MAINPPGDVRIASILLAAVILASGCASDNPVAAEEQPAPVQLTVKALSGSGQTARQSETLQNPVILVVEDPAGVRQVGVDVSGEIVEGGGELSETRLQTDADGKVSFQWTLGQEYNNTARFTAGDASTRVSAVARYRYFRPANDQDGWETAALDEAAAAPLFSVIDGVRSGLWKNIHSVLIARGGELVFETYFPGRNSNGQAVNWSRFTPHEVQSASKSYRSALIGMAIDQGLISGVDEPLSTFFPDHSQQFKDGKESITLENVLTMSSGLEWDETGAAAGNTTNSLSQMYQTPASNWTGFVLTKPLQYSPGSTFVYNTGASIMLNDILARGTGIQVADFVREHMATPLESANLPGVGNPLGASTRPRDMLKLGQVYLTRGMWKNTRVLSERWIDESLTERFQFNSGLGYGYQWWMRTLNTDTATYRVQYAAGNGGQYIILVRELDLVIVSTGGNFGSSLMDQIWSMLENGILPAFE